MGGEQGVNEPPPPEDEEDDDMADLDDDVEDLDDNSFDHEGVGDETMDE